MVVSMVLPHVVDYGKVETYDLRPEKTYVAMYNEKGILFDGASKFVDEEKHEGLTYKDLNKKGIRPVSAHIFHIPKLATLCCRSTAIP